MENRAMANMKLKTLIDFLNRLESANIYYRLNKVNKEYIMVEVVVPGERWEVEFSHLRSNVGYLIERIDTSMEYIDGGSQYD
jgi:hypothetical protein